MKNRETKSEDIKREKKLTILLIMRALRKFVKVWNRLRGLKVIFVNNATTITFVCVSTKMHFAL